MTLADRAADPTGTEPSSARPARSSAGRGDGFLRKSGTFLIGTLLRTVAQGALFVLLAREMPIEEYGLFVGVTALVAVVSPFSSAGAPSLIFQSHADRPADWGRHLARGLVLTVTFGLGASVLVTAAGAAIWAGEVSLFDVAALAVADLVAWRLIEAVAASVQARGRIFVASAVPAVLHVCRLAGAVALAAASAGPVTLHGWAITAMLLSAVVCLLAIGYGLRGARLRRAAVRGSFGQVRTGMLFAVGLSAQTVYNDLDKVMLTRLGSPEAAAVYAAAYRVVDFAYTPGRAMAAVAYPRFFEAGRDGPRAALRLTRRLLPRYLMFSVPAALLLVAFSWLMPIVFGAEYAPATTALQGLSALLVLKAIHYLAADTLSGSRLQGRRTVCQIAVGVVNAGLNVWLIPAYGWQGAVASSLVCDALLGVLLWSCLIAAIRRDPSPVAVSLPHPTTTIERA
ncbi:lipopolysaccharide biosynthesis protein [Micromonospora sp. NPDC048999]|uniref:lipopolysaccharide biosynthesis protein n=1 Tax=Micromonospora sp. NPDC048999 TaxID=3155391 RepID=UPI0033EC6470